MMRKKEFTRKIKEVRGIVELQRKSITDEYMRGLYNGMELILSTFESREPKYIETKLKENLNEKE